MEAIKQAENSVVTVLMRSGDEIRGKLITSDDYMNLSLEEAEIVLPEGKIQKVGTAGSGVAYQKI